MDVHGDAWGTLTTPTGTWSNTIKVRRMDYLVDSTFIDPLGNGNYQFVNSSGPTDTSITHFFMNTGQIVLMTIDEDPENPGMSDGADYIVLVVSVEEHPRPVTTVFPNPALANGHITIRSEKRFDRIVVTNASGQIVIDQGFLASDIMKLHTANLSAGIYLYRLYDGMGAQSGTGKFTVAR